MRKALLIFGGIMLAGLLALVLLSEFAPARPRGFTGDVGLALPEVPGWTRREIPIAGSSAAIASAQGILNFSQAKQILYTRGGVQMLVYVAYWEPGKVSVVDAGSHNPDSCWVNNGCVRTERLYGVPGRVGERELLPYEYGQYIVPNGGKQNVAFWHLVNGEPNRYEDQQAGWRDGLIGRLERLPLVWKDIRAYGINQKNEQMFVRISSGQRVEELMADPANSRLFNELSRLGIYKDSPWK
jgi:hypothetical protein